MAPHFTSTAVAVLTAVCAAAAVSISIVKNQPWESPFPSLSRPQTESYTLISSSLSEVPWMFTFTPQAYVSACWLFTYYLSVIDNFPSASMSHLVARKAETVKNEEEKKEKRKKVQLNKAPEN